MDFEVLYNSYYKQVFSYVMTLAKNRERAEEITQETFTRALASGKGYRKESGELTWLCSIARNFFIDDTRRKKHETEMPRSEETGEEIEIAADTNIEMSVEDEDSSYRIHMILHTLEEPYKEVFQLRVFGELPFEKIGTIFGKTENWARVTYHRARLKIQERMEE